MDQNELDRVVTLVADRTSRNVSLDDVAGRVLAHSTVHSATDRVRVDAVLRKSVADTTKVWEASIGVGSRTRAFQVEGNENDDILPRICIPLLVRGVRAGYIWVLANGHDDDLAAMLDSFDSWKDAIDRLAERVLVATGLASAASTLADRELEGIVTATSDQVSEDFSTWFVRHSQSRLLVFSIEEFGKKADLMPSLAYAQALEDTTRAHGVQAIRFADEQHGVCLVPSEQAATEFAARVKHALLLRSSAMPGLKFMYGVSAPVREGGACRVAYRQAITALQSSAVDPSLSSHAFENTGIYQLLAQLASVNLPSRLEMLRAGTDFQEHRQLLEAVYDHTGSMQSLATKLHMHRTSIYNQLGRMQKIIGVDPLNPLARQELHAGLKLMRWVSRPRFEAPTATAGLETEAPSASAPMSQGLRS